MATGKTIRKPCLATVCACLLSGFAIGKEIPAETAVDDGFAACWARCFAEKTSLLYTCPPEQVKKAAAFTDGVFDWHKGIPGGYGEGMADCALIHGVALSGCVDRWESLARRGRAPDDPEMVRTADWGARLAQGLLNLASRHRFKGFVARGLCWEDGVSICSLSSRDQYTHWVHGLWRYARSPMARADLVAAWKVRIAEVAERMAQMVTPERGYDFGLCDGRPDPRGICTMWWPDRSNADSSCRLAAIYAAAAEATGDGRWRERYEQVADKACFDATQAFVERDRDVSHWRINTPAYVLLQANSALEVLLAIEKNPRRVADIRTGMALFAAEADERAKMTWANPKKKWYGMCAEGELALAQLMAPDWTLDATERAILGQMLAAPDPANWGTLRAVHYFAAYWRAAVRGVYPEKAKVNPSKWNDVDISKAPLVQERRETVAGKAASLLPPGKAWKLVWHDEFDGAAIDRTKWMCRESFWGSDFPAFAHDFEGVEMTGETVRLHLLRKGDDFCSPHLQTGSLTYDIPKDTKGFWPFGAYRRPLFMHRYGYYEIRCRLPKYPGWHAAFWLQAPGVGSSPDPATCGVETDVMENYRQHTDGKIVGGNGWNGYGSDSKWFGHFAWDYEADQDGWCYYGVEWTSKGYTFYANGKKVGEQNEPVSHVEQFVLVSTEPGGYRKVGSDGGLTAGRDARTWGKPDPRLFDVVLPDFFEVDFVRVYDEVTDGTENENLVRN